MYGPDPIHPEFRYYSFWQQSTSQRADFLIVGGGIVGLTAAIALREAEPAARVVVLENGPLPNGASARNAGFACFGSPSELLADLERHGPDTVAELVEMRYRGLQLLRQTLGDAAIGYEACGGYELLTLAHAHIPDHLTELNHLLGPVLGPDAFQLLDWDDSLPFRRESFAGRVLLRCEGSLHPVRMLQALLRKAVQVGVVFAGGCSVRGIHLEGGVVELNTAGSVGSPPMLWYAGQVGICTNGYTGELLPELPVRPGRGQVLITKPVPGLSLGGVYHMDAGFGYFRPVGDRLLLGGWRNLCEGPETTTENQLNPWLKVYLEERLHQDLLPGRSVEIEQMWCGIMGFTESGRPIVQRLRPWLTVGAGLNGMGVAIGSSVGRAVAALMRGQANGGT